ncbi:MAG: TolC family protein [Lewinellaceae bacterium]|nr:TolC family protein [Phaeodactylibacter sp.]MCB9041644.1 TolC family protein [Lewinellaceae bacterium]
MRKILSPIILLLLAWPALAQQQARQMSLEDAIQYALTESIKIKNAQIAIADAEQQIIERRAAGIPQLSGSVQYTHYLKVPRQPLPEGFDIFNIFGQALAVDLYDQLSENTQAALDNAFQGSNGGSSDGIAFFLKNNFTAGLNLDAMVFDGSYFVALRAAREFRTYTTREFATKKREVENAVIEAYLPVLLIQENIELLDKNISNLEQLFFETKELYKAGFAEQLDIDRQELSLSNLQAERDNLRRQKEVAMENLKFNMGYPLDEPLVVSDDLNLMLTDATPDALAANFDPSRRPEFELLDQAITMNELNIKLNQAGYLPSLRAFGTYQQQYQGDDLKNGFWAPSAFVGLSLNVPIFDGLEKKAKIERARLDLELARNQKEDLGRAITLEVKNARTNYLNASQRLQSQQKNLALAGRIYETTQVKYREGVGSSLEVTQAEQSLYASQSNYMQALYDLLLAKARLDMALGN